VVQSEQLVTMPGLPAYAQQNFVQVVPAVLP
jgi:hypothetical protein